MKFSMIALLFLGAAQAVHAADLHCQTPANAEYSPRVAVIAQVSDAYASGAELNQLTDLHIVAGTSTDAVAVVDANPAYRPRIENRVRFDLSGIDASEGDIFSGIVHGLIFPKVITKNTFTAMVISSTDSYHDGIYSYFPMTCEIK